MLVKNKQKKRDTAGSYHITIVSFNKHFFNFIYLYCKVALVEIETHSVCVCVCVLRLFCPLYDV